jgi:3-oxoadipyl-CoA thiolase
MGDVFIADACRTPIGRYAGALSSVRPDDLLAHVIRAILDRNPGLDPAAIEEVFAGAANQSGEDNRNVARLAGLLAGLPVTVPGVTVNRLCASGLEAVAAGYRALKAGEGEVYLCGGVESMSRAPMVLAKATEAFGRTPEIYDTTIGWRFVNKRLAEMYAPISMGETAENVAEQWGITREAQDAFALASQQKAVAAQQAGSFDAELVPVEVPRKRGGAVRVDKDEHPRADTTLETLASLKPAFRAGGTVTAGNTSGINDGAAMTLLCTKKALMQYNLRPLARIVATASAGVPPEIMGIGPVPATRKALQRAGLSISDIGLAELNEAFAAQSLAVLQDLQLDPAIVNVNGGAIALGHPLGCSGARILTTLVHEMHRRPKVRFGLATLCVGVGQGQAVIVEKI